ncbi:hypothetical protein LPB136_10640 [Tenacibaculum todarodis]|uniref:Uncharacterized protein n=1 Tax=Tenacibaculum todarodis TaxID=1850252 RepID=A0A1L3JL32_9FLAO|nr:ankyrin repeat domain-containing protein [Tenacibaculum todarodis]APG65794.1 hypothetical protein LPB136_10640 [Tenacibaculum todarodis]
MKKLAFILVVFTLSFNTVNANNNLNSSLVTTSIEAPKLSALCQLIVAGNYDAVESLIKNGTDINRKSTGLTPLMFAARYNKTKIAKLLIKHGAKLNVKSEKGFTALEYAKMSKAKDAYSVIKTALETA